MISDRTVTVVIGVVTVIWAGSNLAAIFAINDYHPPAMINGISMTVVGGAIAARARDGGRGDRK